MVSNILPLSRMLASTVDRCTCTHKYPHTWESTGTIAHAHKHVCMHKSTPKDVHLCTHTRTQTCNFTKVQRCLIIRHPHEYHMVMLQGIRKLITARHLEKLHNIWVPNTAILITCNASRHLGIHHCMLHITVNDISELPFRLMAWTSDMQLCLLQSSPFSCTSKQPQC